METTTINQLFSTSVAKFAARPALIEPVDGDEMSTLTYSGLQERVHRFAGYLQEQGLKRDDCILIWSASRIDWMVSYLAALFVGLIVVPVDVEPVVNFASLTM